MVMSRKHYHEVAEIIKAERDAWVDANVVSRGAVETATFVLANRFATMFAMDNRRFDREKFLGACGIE